MTYMTAQTTSSTCCQRGDWDSADHQPNGAILFVPVTVKAWPKSAGSHTYFDQTPTAEYRWECIYCGRVGTAAELKS